jgi:hypothetical protein
LVLFIVQAEIPDEKDRLMEQFLAIRLFVHGLSCVDQYVVKKMVELLLRYLQFAKHLLSEPIVHAEDVVHNLDRCDS